MVRLTADCPLLDPDLVGLVAATWRTAPQHDYVATTLVRTLPRGLDVELATVPALRALASSATGYDRVHVTSGLYGDPERFRCLGVVVAPAANDLRVTLDTADDLHALEGLVERLGDRTDWRSVVSVLRSNPDLVERNAHVRQKSLTEG